MIFAEVVVRHWTFYYVGVDMAAIEHDIESAHGYGALKSHQVMSEEQIRGLSIKLVDEGIESIKSGSQTSFMLKAPKPAK
ncbi:MAG: hypothetical protein JWL82_225 [Parcubacteria group bacterium]|nr:hypothetical protein [Parcubacteria group bacterium]